MTPGNRQKCSGANSSRKIFLKMREENRYICELFSIRERALLVFANRNKDLFGGMTNVKKINFINNNSTGTF